VPLQLQKSNGLIDLGRFQQRRGFTFYVQGFAHTGEWALFPAKVSPLFSTKLQVTYFGNGDAM
jgi:hypothetical protein